MIWGSIPEGIITCKSFTIANLLPRRGLEPLRIAPPDPKSGASANFATSALGGHSLPQFSKMPIPVGGAGAPHVLVFGFWAFVFGFRFGGRRGLSPHPTP